MLKQVVEMVSHCYVVTSFFVFITAVFCQILSTSIERLYLSHGSDCCLSIQDMSTPKLLNSRLKFCAVTVVCPGHVLHYGGGDCPRRAW